MTSPVNFCSYYYSELKKCDEFAVKNLLFACVTIAMIGSILFLSLNQGQPIIHCFNSAPEFLFFIGNLGAWLGIMGFFVKSVIDLHNKYKREIASS
jgi:hypothetical protein